MDRAPEDHPKIVAFPPLLWLIGAVVSVLVHYFVFSIRILPEPLAMILGIVCLLKILQVARRAGRVGAGQIEIAVDVTLGARDGGVSAC